MSMKPEESARQNIDRLLSAAGWILQERDQFNRSAGLGVAVREFPMGSAGFVDYLLFIDGKAAGVVEAKKVGVTLSGVEEQSDKYAASEPKHLVSWGWPLRFAYETTGVETFFIDLKDPRPRSRRVFAFHTPETLFQWLQEDQTLRGRLQRMPALRKDGLRDCQIDAIQGLEESLKDSQPRALIQLATGAGKTFTACTFSWRLLKHAKARRILFLVDRRNLGDQALKEFQNFLPPGAPNRFTDTYIVQQLRGKHIDRDAKVVISTIQGLFASLRDDELDPVADQTSDFETDDSSKSPAVEVGYNPEIPIETFDFIITDEAHRSIYGVWRQVLEYFDATIIGLTATPSKHTLAFFNQNLVVEYPYERSVIDGVNVGFEIYRIKTRVSEKGGKIEVGEEGFEVPVRDKRTRKERYKKLDEDLEYSAKELDRSVLNPNQIRTVLQSYKDRVFTELFPDRTGEWLPKTLIFAKDDNHAEEIVRAVREVFGEGNEFAKKITYNVGSEKPKNLIKSFRVDPMPRIAVTVDMIATGTDIKPVEVLIFMRDVKSEGYYEQMKGRGVRTIPDADLQQVTPDAKTKTRFILVDAVGVTESKKSTSQPLERKRTVPFDKLLEQVAMGRHDEDALSSLASRLAALERQLDNHDRERIKKVSGGKSPQELASRLLDAIDPDIQENTVQREKGDIPTEEQREEVIQKLAEHACAPFNTPELRKVLIEIKRKTDLIIDEFTSDELLAADFDVERAKETIKNFKTFMDEHRDELLALQILYNQPRGQQKLTYDAIRELTDAMLANQPALTTANVWQAYKRLDAKSVRSAPVDDLLTEVISLVRYALGQTDALESFDTLVQTRMNLWLGRQENAGITYNKEQTDMLWAIARYIGANTEISRRDFMNAPSLSDQGGILKAQSLFGNQLNDLLNELEEVLVA